MPPNPAKRGPKPKETPPIETAIRKWLATQALSDPPCLDDLVADAPRRFVIYEPMALLPSGSFMSERWVRVLAAAGAGTEELWRVVLDEISRRNGGGLRCLAVNDGIPSHLGAREKDTEEGKKEDKKEEGKEKKEEDKDKNDDERDTKNTKDTKENILRSPTGLRMLFGNFGPGEDDPGVKDVDAALWVSTRQNGITQVWAPQWTMFSRGNVKEKGRLLGFYSLEGGNKDGNTSTRDGDGCTHLQDPEVEREIHQRRLRILPTKTTPWAVDLYAGIGYFAFSYVRLGMRVLCWELNPWSVEGLRRGARANGWRVAILRRPGDGGDISTADIDEAIKSDAQIIVFLESNAHALQRIRGMPEEVRGRVVHVNCGFLPTSELMWKTAWELAAGGVVLRRGASAWMHLHENVGVADIEGRRGEIQERINGWARDKKDGGLEDAEKDGGLEVDVEHVERIKTFAPGVWHCVFDVRVSG